jgi:signal peptidase I
VSYYFDQPKRGEVIIFKYPRDPSKFFIKRVVGAPGDTIDISGSTVTITNEHHPDGIVLDEPYIKSMRPGASLNETLGEHEYFVMGDNRDQSSDSRTWGVLQESYIVGRAFLRLFPPGEVSYFPGSAVQKESVVDTN